ncbi:hypothetical protein [Aequorivita echinoideorum]|nr:hypothetical protein [Aequorivita echinoideorum]
MIWDFRGENGALTAKHHEKHLAEYAESENLEETITGTQSYSPTHHAAFMVVNEGMVASLREILKPHRGQIYEE